VSFVFWSYLTISGNAPSGQSHLCHPFIYGSPASPLLSLTPITKYISSCKINSSTSTFRSGMGTGSGLMRRCGTVWCRHSGAVWCHTDAVRLRSPAALGEGAVGSRLLAVLSRQGSAVGECYMLRLQWRNFGLLLSSLDAHLLQVCGESGVISTKRGSHPKNLK
jgi:hypothetical protein